MQPVIFNSRSGVRFRGAILQGAADVEEGEAELEEDQGVGVVVPAPDDPKDVAQEEEPEAPVAFELALRANHPGRNHRDYHGRPLNQIKHCLKQRDCTLWQCVLLLQRMNAVITEHP